MNPEPKNKPAEAETPPAEQTVILTEENAPVLYEDTAEAFAEDVEVIDLTNDEEE